LGAHREILRVVNDQFTCPTPAENIADTLLAMIEQIETSAVKNPWGIYHYCSQPIVSWYDFATRIFDIAKQYHSLTITQLLSIPSTEYLSTAQRPPHAILNCQKIFQIFGVVQPCWEDRLQSLIKILG
jgi:dTDP-4-dehydrorhamnose reductase